MTAPGALLLFPGAGSDRTHHTLVSIEAALAPLPVTRADFPYRKAGRRAPDRAPVLLAALLAEAAQVVADATIDPDQLVLGGRSMGGRMCSMAVAGDDGKGGEVTPLPSAGLVLISYPLHPPGKPDSLRTAHLPKLHVSCLFIHGTRDPFGTPDELQAATASIPGAVTHVWVEGGRHELAGADPLIAQAVAQWVRSLR